MPTSLPQFTAAWNNTNTTTTHHVNLSIASVYGNSSFIDPTTPIQTPAYFIFTSTGVPGLYDGVHYNVMYNFSISATCTDLTDSAILTVNDKVQWRYPSNNINMELGEWGYKSTDDTISVWFDSIDLDKCRRIDVALFDAAGTVQNGNTITFTALSYGFPDNLKKCIFKDQFNGCVISPDTTYKVRVTIWGVSASNISGPLTQSSNISGPSHADYTVYTKPHSASYKQWIMVGGALNSDPCNIKYQFVVQTHFNATSSSIIHGVEHLYTNFSGGTSLGSLNPDTSINLTLNYIKLLDVTNAYTTTTVYNYDYVNAVFGTPTSTQC